MISKFNQVRGRHFRPRVKTEKNKHRDLIFLSSHLSNLSVLNLPCNGALHLCPTYCHHWRTCNEQLGNQRELISCRFNWVVYKPMCTLNEDKNIKRCILSATIMNKSNKFALNGIRIHYKDRKKQTIPSAPTIIQLHSKTSN